MFSGAVLGMSFQPTGWQKSHALAGFDAVAIHVKQGHVDEFLDAFRINYEGTRREPGNLRLDVLRSPEDDHRKTAHYLECVRHIDPIITGPRTKTFYNVEMADFATDCAIQLARPCISDGKSCRGRVSFGRT